MKESACNFRNHPNWPKHICGEIYNDRIIGGQNAALGQFPWMARLLFKFKGKLQKNLILIVPIIIAEHLTLTVGNDTYTVNCGGSLISERYVLAAAHCVFGEEQDL